jgi:hypothetical protein
MQGHSPAKNNQGTICTESMPNIISVSHQGIPNSVINVFVAGA